MSSEVKNILNDSSSPSDSITIYEKKSFIFDNVNELSLQDRREILQIIYNSQFRSKIKEKGNGVQIKIEELSESIIDKMYNTLLRRNSEQYLEY